MTLPPLITSTVAKYSATSIGFISDSRIMPKLSRRFGASAITRDKKGNC